MKKLAALGLVTICHLAFVVAGGQGAGCSPLECSPSPVPLAGGKLLGVRPDGMYGPLRVLDLRNGRTRWRLPSGMSGGSLLVHQDGTLLTWFNAATGARVGDSVAPVRGRFSLVGVSQDGGRAVLVRTHRTTTFAIVSPKSQRTVVLGGHDNWGFDALSGDKLYLLQYVQHGYLVRLYDLAHNTLDPKPLKDGDESAVISGTPWVRLSSPDGRYLFTLYIDGTGKSMVHELDVRAATARCVDLPGSGDFNSASSYTLSLSADGRTLWAVSTGYGKVVAIDVAGARVRTAFGFRSSVPNSPTGGVSALSPDGARLAVGLAGELWFVRFAQRRVVEAKPRVAIALGFSPDGRRLWLLGEKSRVSALSVR